MNYLISHFKKFDWILILVVFLLVAIGISSLYSISLQDQDFTNFIKQIRFFALGLALMVGISFFNWRNFRENSFFVFIIYLLSVISLVLLFFFAPEIRGTKSWFRIGQTTLSPVEFINIVLIILLAKYFSMRHVEMYRFRHILLSGIYVLIPALLVFFQPNLGSVLVILAIWVGILIISGIKIRHFLLLILMFALVFALSWGTVMKDYQKARILSFLLPEASDPLGVDWSQSQSRIAIGAGGLFGQGFGHGSQTQYGFLPEPHTDFIFSAIAEEWGLMGVLVLLVLFSILIWRLVKIAINSNSNFPRLFSVGLAILLIAQIFIHIGMNIGFLPIIGISLPFVSYGGSGFLALFIALGIILNIKVEQ